MSLFYLGTIFICSLILTISGRSLEVVFEVSKVNSTNQEDKSTRGIDTDGGRPDLWPTSTIYYKFSLRFPHSERFKGQVRSAISVFNRATCLNFVELDPKSRDDPDKRYISVQSDDRISGIGCYASVGYQRNQVNQIIVVTEMDDIGCAGKHKTYGGIFAHELIHSLGFGHEYWREDRDKYITLHIENLKKELDKDSIAKSIEPRKSDTKGIPFNFKSIMQIDPRSLSEDNSKLIFTEVKPLGKGVQKPLGTYKDMGTVCRLSVGDLNLIEKTYYKICGLKSPRVFTEPARLPGEDCKLKIGKMVELPEPTNSSNVESY